MAPVIFSLRKIAFAAGVLAAASAPALAQEAATDSALKLTGFMSIVGGRVLGSGLGADYTGAPTIAGEQCPCYVADWHNAGVYGHSFALDQESRAGIQAKYTVNRDLNLVAQVVVRATDFKPSVQWAYAAYAVNKNWEVQFGRKRIPLYFYSDFQDVGAAYPWVSPPPELYGWEAANYNGASVRYKTSLGDTNVTTSMFAGGETVNDSEYYKLFSTGETKIRWRNLVGGDVELTNGPLTVRGVYIQANTNSSNPSIELDEHAHLKAYGIAANLDFDKWFVLSELTQQTRQFDGYRVTTPSLTVGAGYRFGAWTPFINVARYTERTTDSEAYQPTSWKRASLTLRYDVDARSSVKAQLDRHNDRTRNFGDTVNVVRLAYDRLF